MGVQVGFVEVVAINCREDYLATVTWLIEKADSSLSILGCVELSIG